MAKSEFFHRFVVDKAEYKRAKDMETTIEQLRHELTQLDLTKERVWSEYQSLWHQVGFSRAQVFLWYTIIKPIQRQNSAVPAYQVTPDLGQHLIDLLTLSGGRMPLAQVMKKLPAGITTTEQQIRKLAQQHAQLEIKGPLLVLAH